MRCGSCGFENPEEMKFCGECAAPLKRHCPQCGFANPPGFKFCGECATSLTGQPVSTQPSAALLQPLAPARAEAERRQLTVMFCDLVGSTALSTQLDPEELREVVRAYHETCTTVIQRYEGHIAQHLGDGLLVYFGYPAAHEDDARRAVRTGLEIVETLKAQSPKNRAQPRQHSLAVRIGIHTGVVVIGEIGTGGRTEHLALGETPNIAARVQGVAEPDTVVMSTVTYRLVQGLFECQALGPHTLKGVSTPLSVYRVIAESGLQSRFEVAVGRGLMPLVGREEELGLLRRRWEQAKDGTGQVVLLSGEPGIGKSRLMQTLKEQVTAEGATRVEFRCSPYHQNSAFYPLLEHLQRLLQFAPPDTPQTKLAKLQQTLMRYRFPQADTLSLVAALLSLPHPEDTPPLTLSPQKQKQKTQEALVAWVVEEAERAPVYSIWEDLHWADPSTLEVLTLFLDQVPTTRFLALLTFRPEFISPWGNRSHLSQMTLSRLGRSQVETMVERVTGGKTLPAEVVQQVVAKTDGVPLFVEELTKAIVEAGATTGQAPLATIPSTLLDSLMARLDRLGPAKEIAQWGAMLGREFPYKLLHAVSRVEEARLREGLRQLVAAELVYQSGIPPQARYLFKHALVQDAAYQSLLKSTRQQYHQQIAQVLEERFPETKETQPELLAHHYTEAGLIAQAIPYWQRAGHSAAQRSASVEAISHLTKGLELLKVLPDTSERAQHELTLQTTLGLLVQATKGFGTPEVEQAYARAREICRQVGETPQLLRVLGGLLVFYKNRAEFNTAHELAEQYLRLAQRVRDAYSLVWAHYFMGETLIYLGEFALAQDHLERGIALYDPPQHRSAAFRAGGDAGILSLSASALALWVLGHPDRALRRLREALTLAQAASHPPTLTYALGYATGLHVFRRERQATQEQTERLMAVSTEQGFSLYLALGTVRQGWALVEQGQGEEGIAQIRQGLAAYWATGAEQEGPCSLAWLAEAYGKTGQAEEGLSALSEALAMVDKTGGRSSEAELYRLKGELTLQLSVQHPASGVKEAEEAFQKAIAIARAQQARSWELRTTTSLARLWQQQGKQHEAHQLLSEIYGWFTEGFDTKDLQEAKALLDALAEGC